MNLNFNTKNIIFLGALSIVSAFLGVLIFLVVFDPGGKIFYDEKIKARNAAENELLFSSRLNSLFNSSAPTDFISTAKIATECVVYIRALSKIENKDILNQAYNAETGSGVIISNDGYIVTNYHVIKDAQEVEVLLDDNREFIAKVIGVDPNTDLALLKIEVENLNYLIFGNSDSLQVGEWVMAVGNPFKLQSTVTAGIVSAKGRNINILENQGIESFIQTDAAVNPGNSGGALVNTRGELMGINTAIMSLSGNHEGYAFAVPANLAKKVVNDIRQYGFVQRGWLGVEVESIDNLRAKTLGMPEVAGVFISLVTKGGAASEAGLQSGDVVISIDKKKTNTVSSFTEILGTYRPGDEVDIEFYRAGKRMNLKAVLRNQLNSTDLIAVRKDKALVDLGFELRELDSFEKIKFKSNGVLVVTVYRNSLIDKAKVEPGFIINKVNNVKVSTVNEILRSIEKNDKLYLNGFYENYPGEFPYEINLEK